MRLARPWITVSAATSLYGVSEAQIAGLGVGMSDRLVMAYADPPYPGQAFKHYGNHPDYAGEVDHAALLEQLEDDYPDGWALSTSSPALRDVLPLCPADVRVMAWVKPFAAFKKNVRVAYAWEPGNRQALSSLGGGDPHSGFRSRADHSEAGSRWGQAREVLLLAL
jgi:hypothetical protein